MKIHCLLIGLILTMAPMLSSGQGKDLLKVEDDGNVIRSVTVSGNELNVDSKLAIQFIRIPDATQSSGFRQIVPPVREAVDGVNSPYELSGSFEAWGKLSLKIERETDRLIYKVRIKNDLSEPIYGSLHLHTFDLGGDLAGPGAFGFVWKNGWSLSTDSPWGPPILAQSPNASLVIARMGAENQLSMQFLNRKKQSRALIQINLGSERTPIPAGEEIENTFIIRFGEPKADLLEMVRPVMEAYGKSLPCIVNWPDRRPIATLHPSSSHLGAGALAAQGKTTKNTRGWSIHHVTGDTWDTTSPEGRKEFREKLMEFGKRSVEIMKRMNAQGMIVWSLEGQEFPHTISYVGAPHLLPQLAPEMDECADEFFKLFSDAGFKTGMTLRPQDFKKRPTYQGEMTSPYGWKLNPPQGFPYWQYDSEDPYGELEKRIAYAKNRWGSTIFYVDTNISNPVLRDGKGRAFKDKDGKDRKARDMMDYRIFRRLQEKFPDCLIIPEHETFNYDSSSSPMISIGPRGGLNRLTWPDGRAFAVCLQNFDMKQPPDYNDPKVQAALAQAFQTGNIVLFDGWYWPKYNDIVKGIFDKNFVPKFHGFPADHQGGTEN